jgi:hypothetical protein
VSRATLIMWGDPRASRQVPAEFDIVPSIGRMKSRYEPS